MLKMMWIFFFLYFEYLKKIIDNMNLNFIKFFVEILLVARDNIVNIIFIGNGGSASTASLFANDLAIGKNQYKKPFRAVRLADNLLVNTAIANDYG